MQKGRIAEIDYLRATAIVLMVLFHLIYDLDHYTSASVNVADPFWYWLGKTSAVLFIVVSGISSGFSHHSFRRGLRVLAFAMLITVVTYVIMPDQYVRFGILHFLAVSMMLYPVVRAFSPAALGALALLSFALGLAVHDLVLPYPWLLPLGIIHPQFATIDYYPLFPYLGFTFLGFLGYKLYYYQGKPLLSLPIPKPIAWVSKHSLAIYLVHQPLLLGGICLATIL